MTQTDLRVPMRYYLRLAEVVAAHGVDLQQALRGLGVPAQLFNEPDAMLGFSKVEKLVERLTRATGRSDLGYDLGKRLSVSSHSIVGFGMLSSPTVEHALKFVARYFRLVMPSFRLHYGSVAEGAELHFTPVVAMQRDCMAFHLEAIGMAALREVRELSGGQPLPCRIQFSMPRPPHAHRYAELRGVTTEFGGEQVPGVRLRIAADLHHIPLAMADPNARKMAEARCRAQVAHVASVRQFAGWVSMTLREVNEGLPSLAELAGMLNISPRTLNRHLEREGTTFNALAGRIQHELACERLAQGSMTVTEVAYSLGFKDPANFTRAFRDREGIPPREYRRRQAQGAAQS